MSIRRSLNSYIIQANAELVPRVWTLADTRKQSRRWNCATPSACVDKYVDMLLNDERLCVVQSKTYFKLASIRPATVLDIVDYALTAEVV